MLKSIILCIASLFTGLAQCSGQDSGENSEPVDPFAGKIRPLLDRYCVDCHAHGGNKAEFLWPETEADAIKMRNSFASVLQRMEDGTMPPEDSDQPTEVERKQIKKWIDETFDLKPGDYDRISNYVVESFEDSKGNLWFGTISDGVALYDGKAITWFTTRNGLGGDTVVSIAEDKQGNIWLGTDGGVSRFDGKDFVTYSNEAGLPGTRCYVLVDREGGVWAGTERGVFRFDETKFSRFEIPEPAIDKRSWKVEFGKVWCLTQDRKGNIWIGRDGLGACRFDGTNFTHFTTRDGLCSNNVSSIVEDKQGNIWIGCLSSDHPEYVEEGGLNRFDGRSFAKFPETRGLFETDIYTIYPTRSGDVWIGATGVGAYRYDSSTFALFDETDRPYWTRYFGVQSILEDRNGNLWFGFSGGLFRFNGKSFSNVGKAGPWGANSLNPETGKQEVDETGSEKQDPHQILATPQGWGTEQIKFPLAFAPSINFSGFEDIRFAPGWSDPDSPGFWSYKFVWLIEEDPQLTEARLADLMETYFDGLSRAVAKGSETDLENLQKPVAIFVRDGEFWKGRLRIYDAFSSKDWISLNARVWNARKGDKHLVIVEMSPKPFEHEVWRSLDGLQVK